MSERVTILGVGNILLKDEGFGVHLVRWLESAYRFPDAVELVDGGTLGLRLLSVVTNTDRLLVVDAVKGAGPPGDVYLFRFEDVPYRLRAKNSLHQVDLVDALTMAEFLGARPETVIVGVEPEEMGPWGVELSTPVRRSLERVKQVVFDQLEVWGVRGKPVLRAEPGRAVSGGSDRFFPGPWASEQR